MLSRLAERNGGYLRLSRTERINSLFLSQFRIQGAKIFIRICLGLVDGFEGDRFSQDYYPC